MSSNNTFTNNQLDEERERRRENPWDIDPLLLPPSVPAAVPAAVPGPPPPSVRAAPPSVRAAPPSVRAAVPAAVPGPPPPSVRAAPPSAGVPRPAPLGSVSDPAYSLPPVAGQRLVPRAERPGLLFIDLDGGPSAPLNPPRSHPPPPLTRPRSNIVETHRRYRIASNTEGQVGYVHPQRSWHQDRPATLYKITKKRPDMSREGTHIQPLGPRGWVIHNIDQWEQDVGAAILALRNNHQGFVHNTHTMFRTLSGDKTGIRQSIDAELSFPEYSDIIIDQYRILLSLLPEREEIESFTSPMDNHRIISILNNAVLARRDCEELVNSIGERDSDRVWRAVQTHMQRSLAYQAQVPVYNNHGRSTGFNAHLPGPDTPYPGPRLTPARPAASRPSAPAASRPAALAASRPPPFGGAHPHPGPVGGQQYNPGQPYPGPVTPGPMNLTPFNPASQNPGQPYPGPVTPGSVNHASVNPAPHNPAAVNPGPSNPGQQYVGSYQQRETVEDPYWSWAHRLFERDFDTGHNGQGN